MDVSHKDPTDGSLGRQQPDDDIIAHYEAIEEGSRLAQGRGLPELARTQEILERYLPSPPAVVVDVGGGPGVYAFWLASRGYVVHLIDPVPKHIEQADRQNQRRRDHPLASVAVGDARRLPQPDGCADIVLLMGPLYHLAERADRLAALGEAKRVLGPGGLLVGAAINRFASLFDGFVRGYIDDPNFIPILERDLRDGQHRNPTDRLEYFTTAFFHHPEDLRAEVAEAGFSVKAVLPAEGPAWLINDLDRYWTNPLKRAYLLDLLRRIEHEDTLLGVSAHLLVVASKTSDAA